MINKKIRGGMRDAATPKIPGIYAIRNMSNKKIYIGASTRVFHRMQNHFIGINKNTAHYKYQFNDEVEMFGPDRFEIFLLEYCDIEKLSEREQHYIDKYNSIEYGYNRAKSHPKNFNRFKGGINNVTSRAKTNQKI